MTRKQTQAMSSAAHFSFAAPTTQSDTTTSNRQQKYANTLEKAQEDRVVDQYGIEVLTNDDAEWILEDAKDFVLKIEEILAK